MESRPYKLICNSELALISRRVREAWSGWCRHWLLEVKPESVLCVPADADANTLNRVGQQWRRFSSEQEGELSILVEGVLPTRLAALAFGSCVPQVGTIPGIGPSRLLTDLMNVMLGDLAVARVPGSGVITSAEQLDGTG
jgi:hypothetical protein